jgi:serine/threonine protein kinase
MTRQDDDTATVFSAPPVKRAEPVEDSAKGFPFKHYYKLGETLGEGGFGKVKRAEHKKLNETRAVKIINKTKLECHGLESLKDEISALKLLRGGPHIVRLFDVFEEQRYTYIIMEEMKGGELLRRIVDKEVYTEREARAVCRILFSAIDYCHKFKIAHRDLKPENLLLQDVSDDTSIKIADFGFAKRVRKPNSLTTLCGTANYIAPEVLDLTSPGYDERADIWSCGVIMYVLLGGYQPFQGPIEELANKIQRGEYKFHNEYWMYTSPSAKNLISSCLRVNPNDRITADEALASDWMNTDEETLTGNDLTVAQHKIREGLPIDKLKGAVYTVMLTNKMTSLEEKFTSTLGDRRAFENRQRKNAAKPAAVATSGSAPAPTTPEAAPAPVAHANIPMTISEESTGGSKLFGEVYSLGGAFGSGSFSVVHEAVQRHTTEEVAVKVVDRRQLNPADAVRLQDEIVALRELVACPHIVELYDVFDEPDTTFLVMERMRGGELIERIIKRAHYTEADARAVCRNLLLGVQFCHSKSIANRNLKPENLLLSTEGSDVDVKISDFGCAKKVLYPNSLRTQCGTEGYTAPEILEHRPEYDVPCDMWSLGVVLYILIGGYRPFRGSGTEIMRQIRYGEYEFHEQYWNHVSREAKDLIKRMMTVHPIKRITAAEALESDWMVADDSTLQSDLSPNQTGLRAFNGKAKMRKVVQMMIAMNKLQGLAESYRALDEDF